MCVMKRIHFLKPGLHTDRNGTALEFSEAIRKDIAASYDPSIHEAPLVIGHPKTDDPAWGWVKSIELAEDGAHAVPKQVNAEFEEMVVNGHFKKISCSVYLPDSPSNPKPGHHYLRHIGFLGATPPAIKGLSAIEYADNEVGVLYFEDYATMSAAGLFSRIRDFFIDQFGLEKADSVLPSYEIDYLKTIAARDETTDSTMYTEPITTNTEGGDPVKTADQQAAEFAERETKLVADAATLKAREDAVLAKERSNARQSTVDFCEGLIKSGQMLPVQREAFTEALIACDGREPVEFSEGDKKFTSTPRAALEAALKAMPKLVEFGEKAKPAAGGLADLPEDPIEHAKELSKRALEYVETKAKAGVTVGVMEAFANIEKEAAK